MLQGPLPALVTPFTDGAPGSGHAQELVEGTSPEGSNGLVPVEPQVNRPTLTQCEHENCRRRKFVKDRRRRKSLSLQCRFEQYHREPIPSGQAR